MILVNRNFGTPTLSTVIGDMFRYTTDDMTELETNPLHRSALLASSGTAEIFPLFSATSTSNTMDTAYNDGDYYHQAHNFRIVTEKYLKTLDKVYTKIWNESFMDSEDYNHSNIVTLGHAFVSRSAGNDSTSEYGNIKNIVDKMIDAGYLAEEDRLDFKDDVLLDDMNNTDMSTYVDLEAKTVTMSCTKPITVYGDLDATTGSFYEGKKLYLFFTPYHPNYKSLTNSSNAYPANPHYEPFYHTNTISGINAIGSAVYFKPKTAESKWQKSLPMATHLVWRIGTPEEKEIALLEGTEVPEVILDHTDRISHIDSLELKIKFDKLQF